MSPADLRLLISRFDPGGPIHLRLAADLRRGRTALPWYRDQREHLLGWLAEIGGPGFYGRAVGVQSASLFWNRFQCVECLCWLAEAAGVPELTLMRACEAVRMCGSNHAAQCGAFRRVVPWREIEARLPPAGEDTEVSIGAGARRRSGEAPPANDNAGA